MGRFPELCWFAEGNLTTAQFGPIQTIYHRYYILKFTFRGTFPYSMNKETDIRLAIIQGCGKHKETGNPTMTAKKFKEILSLALVIFRFLP